MAASRSSASMMNQPPTASFIPTYGPSVVRVSPPSTRTVVAFSGRPIGSPGGDARRLVDPLVVGVDLLLFLLGERGLSLERGALVDQHDVLHRLLLVTAGWSRSKTNDEPGNRHPDTGILTFLRVDRREDENGHLPGRLRLVLGVVRPHRDGPLQPGRVLLVVDLPGLVVLLDRAVLELHVRVRGQVVVPDGVLGCAAQRRDDGVLALVLDAHQRRLAELPGLGTDRRQHDHGLALIVGALGAAGALVPVHLIAAEIELAGLVFPGERHVST